MYVVITRVQLLPGKIDTVRNLFEQTNPALVEGQADWIEAKFTANREKHQVTVLAYWKNADSYERFRTGDEFQQVMSRFAPHFESPPEVTINEVLFEM
ncbi:MAG: hypothetical protein GF372_05890 [Candidatus Marinimicrobia bacterium]|nr:hypothetical protein [Candidatus Neomarinimicrobiota bacterium]